MEEFNDVSSFGLTKEMSEPSVYELNTSMFDKDPFIFNANGSNRNDVENNIVPQNSDLGVLSSDTSNLNAYNNYKILSFNSADTSLFNVDDSPSSTRNNKQYSKVSSSNVEFHQISTVLENSEVSNRCNEPNEGSSKVLVIINLKTSTQENLERSSITEEVVDLESANFNILDLVANEDITSVSPEDIFDAPSTPDSHFSKDIKPSERQNKYISEKRPRKRRKYNEDSEDDEDCVQQTETYARTEADIKYKVKDNNEYVLNRAESVSPSCSKDSYSTKYRELRDKKNEASRKSSLKRKIKELELKKEAEELVVKNIKLKAHVEQLEKIVTNYRENLFKMNKK